MDLHILHDGREIGPFTPEAACALLREGAALPTDLAWRPRMPRWIPLCELLAIEPPPAPAPAPVLAPAPPIVVARPIAVAESEPATARQKALLSYLGLPFGDALLRTGAALLISDAMEHAGHSERFEQWMQDRLRQHPDLFAAEIQARWESRADRHLQRCQSAGADCFTQLSKAHVQVLLNYLDVSCPNWDADEDAAHQRWLLPAMAQKFPRLVKPHWKGRLKFPSASNLAAAPARARSSAVAAVGFPFAAAVRGIVLGLLLLLAAGMVWVAVQDAAVAEGRPRPARHGAAPSP